MSETPPPRRPLATFLRATPAAPALIPTPAVPPTEPPEQAPPAPVAELPPAPAQQPVPAPLSPLAPAPDVGVPDTARGDGVQAVPGAGVAAGPVTTQQATQQTMPATGHDAAAADADATWEPDAAAIHAGTQAPGATPLLPLPTPTAPAFARRGLSRPRLRASGRQWALLVGLVGVLALQIVIADRAHLAGDARWRPLVSAACTVLRCSLPAWREPAALTLLNREVRPMHGMPGVLQIQASFRNDARWAQAWPWLQLSLSDADGRVIGTRVLAPQEYLGQAPAEQDTLAPGQAVQVAFRVREPAASTAAFSFDFR
ncbi:DUF3426 domain-containing protein [Xanthomonas campestris]|uniref:DUF3426 domain-containing protein n=1 Tax=Xanthomonas campestris TaxID=339 RepID=UPI001E314FBA|nr:DUF3426 domain-containing protein [Xanthomonas campestris]MCC4605708.1 DUF3426 domain-containing protein [Xanthomonas campestris pv. parthenii]